MARWHQHDLGVPTRGYATCVPVAFVTTFPLQLTSVRELIQESVQLPWFVLEIKVFYLHILKERKLMLWGFFCLFVG